MFVRSVAADIVYAEVVREDENDVGFCSRVGSKSVNAKEREDNENGVFHWLVFTSGGWVVFLFNNARAVFYDTHMLVL